MNPILQRLANHLVDTAVSGLGLPFALIDSVGRESIDLGNAITQLLSLQAAATAASNGTTVNVDGFNGAQILEIFETGGGTAAIALQGSMDGTSWISGVGYQQTDNIASPVRSVSNIAVAAGSRHTYQILDPFKYLRAVLSSPAGGAAVTVRLYAVGV